MQTFSFEIVWFRLDRGLNGMEKRRNGENERKNEKILKMVRFLFGSICVHFMWS